MKYMKRAGIYKAANVTFDPIKVQAYSYSWWRFVGIVEGKVVFNNYRYSSTTSKHQSKVRNLMKELGIKIDFELPLRQGILFENETSYKHGTTTKGQTLEQMIIQAEEYLCGKFLEEQVKKQERYQKQKERKQAAKLLALKLPNQSHLENLQ
jgi:hypothetical protein